MCDVTTLKRKLQQQYDNLEFKPEIALPDLGLNSFTKKYIKNILARVTGFIEESTGVASNYCNYMNTQTKNPFEIEHIITDHYEWFTDEYADQEDFRRWRNSVGALNCSNEGNIYTESLGQLAYQNNRNSRNLLLITVWVSKPTTSLEKRKFRNVLPWWQLVRLVWNDEMFK